jgi:perosamine synthetase
MRRESIARQYSHILAGRPEFKLPSPTVPFGKISWFVYVIQLGMQFTQLHRDWIVQEMHLRGIGVGRYFAPIHLQSIYKGWAARGTLQVTEQVATRTIALPFFNLIRNGEIDEVCNTLIELVDSVAYARLRTQSAAG